MKKMFILILILFITGCSEIDKNPDFTMDATEFSTLTIENEIQASLTYEGKIVKISGVVNTISGNKDEVRISLYPNIYVVITSKIKDTVDIKQYSTIEVQGKVVRGMFGGYSLENCKIIKHEKDKPADYKLTVENFLKEYAEDSGKTSKKYLYKTIEITGYLYIGYSFDHQMLLVKKNGMGIKIYFEDKEVLSKLKDNQTLTVRGVYFKHDDPMWGSYASVGGCVIVD